MLNNKQEDIALFFDSGINRFIDENGNIVHDIYRIITPNQFMMFREGNLSSCMDRNHSFNVDLIDQDDEPTPLYYDAKTDTFIDEGGWTVTWLYDIVTKGQVHIFKRKKEDMYVRGRMGDTVGLYYPDAEYDDEDEEDY